MLNNHSPTGLLRCCMMPSRPAHPLRLHTQHTREQQINYDHALIIEATRDVLLDETPGEATSPRSERDTQPREVMTKNVNRYWNRYGT